MKKLLAILWASAKTVFLVFAFLACMAFLGILACAGFQMLLMEMTLLKGFGVFLLAFSLAEALYLIALVRMSRGIPAPQSLTAE